MKRAVIFLLLAALLLALPACRKEGSKLQQPVNFYYRRAETVYGTSDGLIAAFPAEGKGYEDAPLALLNQYLQGPSDDTCISPFPSGCKVQKLTVTDSAAYVEMHPAFSRLSGIDLTVACACLSLTVMDLTGAESVTITASGTSLDGAPQIVMDRACLTLLDLYVPETTES